MVGPLAKISEADLPRRPNIVYYGKQDYSALPSYLACFDVAMMPFALNEATRFISPTKTLEYLAAGKPVVSTPIPDVVALYRSVVRIGDSAASFIAAIEEALAEPAATVRQRQRASAAMVTNYHWDSIADRMWGLMASVGQHASQSRPLLGPSQGRPLAVAS
jgi:UDP-galactopyranose mutase